MAYFVRMHTKLRLPICALAMMLLLVYRATATLIPRLSFEQLTDSSELIVSGRIAGTWTAWDTEHKYIWTHYSLSVASSLKGSAAPVVEFAEPGGVAGSRVMTIAGTVNYRVGDNIVVFLSRMPNGYLRTAGWSQGKYLVDAGGRLHGQALPGAEIFSAGHPGAGSSPQTLEGMGVDELRRLVAARLRSTQGRLQ